MVDLPVRRLVAALSLILLGGFIGWLGISGIAAGFDAGLLRVLSPRDGRWALWFAAMRGLTEAASVLPRVIMILIAAGILVARGRARAAAMLIVTCATGALLVEAIKDVVQRPRPLLLPHLDAVHSFSFPSAHASNATIVFGAIAILFAAPRHRLTALVTAGTVAFFTGVSRLVLAVHWPTDVLAGWCIGSGWLILCFALARRRMI
ncbi:phosphatase PAP2 family protein [Flavisphingomonas formosensis]|uniref:phosphatase PAP2 family protein n=1 Tax=Flavisphingomonas formosensis TaxID=861534 RepID=UPI0012F8EC7F|nr:phosphatase PAP2 family protein [Sphingomonas formosensis]